jgi:predicted hotdog family 3-hydroxylacyl-ACP dehydratase
MIDRIDRIEGDELLSLVPHKGRMFLLSRILSYNPVQRILVSEFDIKSDCLFYEEALRGIPAWISFELMAQSISAISGIEGRKRGEPPQFGFILSVSGLEITEPVLPAGSSVKIQVTEDVVVDNVFSFSGEVSRDGKNIAQAKLTVMETREIWKNEAS